MRKDLLFLPSIDKAIKDETTSCINTQTVQHLREVRQLNLITFEIKLKITISNRILI